MKQKQIHDACRRVLRWRWLLLLLFAGSATAQEVHFFSDVYVDQLENELSGIIAKRYAEELYRLQREPGTHHHLDALRFVANEARKAGLSHVALASLPQRHKTWEPRRAELWVLSPVTKKLANLREVPTALAVYSRSRQVHAELVDVGRGEEEADYARVEVANKVVLASGDVQRVMREAVWKRGALGILAYTPSGVPATVSPWLRLPTDDGQGKESTFAFSLPAANANALKRLLQSAAPAGQALGQTNGNTQASVLIRVDIEASVKDARQRYYVSADLPGEKFAEETIVLTAPLLDNTQSPNVDVSGAATLLEIGRTLARLTAEGVLPPPRRAIRFLWLPEARHLQNYLQTYPAAKDSMLVNFHLAAAGFASEGTRTYFVSRPPFSMPHFWGDLVEKAVEQRYQRATLGPARIYRAPNSRSIDFSTASTEAPYDLRLVPHFVTRGNVVFSDAAIGVPGISLTSGAEMLIGDEEAYVPRLNAGDLRQNGLLVATASWYLASFRDTDIPELAALVYSQIRARLAHALHTAFTLLVTGKEAEEGGRYYALAELVLEESLMRAGESLNSVNALAEQPQALESVNDFLRLLRDDEKGARDQLQAYFVTLFQQRPPRPSRPTEAERAAQRLIPNSHPELRTYLARKDRARVDVHPVLATEIFNFVDGRRSIYEIYRAVLAESLLTGSWAYGEVTLRQVQRVVDEAVRAGALAY